MEQPSVLHTSTPGIGNQHGKPTKKCKHHLWYDKVVSKEGDISDYGMWAMDNIVAMTDETVTIRWKGYQYCSEEPLSSVHPDYVEEYKQYQTLETPRLNAISRWYVPSAETHPKPSDLGIVVPDDVEIDTAKIQEYEEKVQSSLEDEMKGVKPTKHVYNSQD
eukprot:803913_1